MKVAERSTEISIFIISIWFFQLDLQRHNQQYPPIDIHTTQRNHDRFLIIDDVVYLFGASLKDAGKKLFAYIKMQETPIAQLLNNIR